HRVGHAGAAAVLDADAHAGDRLLGLAEDVLDARRRRIGQSHDLGARAGAGHFHLLSPGSRPGRRSSVGLEISMNSGITTCSERPAPRPTSGSAPTAGPTPR